MASNSNSAVIDQYLFPKNYIYKIISYDQREGNNVKLQFKIKDIKSGEDVLKWVKEYEELSVTTWRVARSVKSSGVLNIFRRDLRCQHNTDKRYRKKNQRCSKNTDCPATMKIVINRFTDQPKLKKVDEETKEYPCIAELNYWHNHSSSSIETLKSRNMSDETIEKLLNYYKKGHSVSSARHELQTELLQSTCSDFSATGMDSAIIPSISKIRHLFDKTTYGPDLKIQFKKWCERINVGLENNPEIFIPAIKKFLSNTQKYASTEAGLVSALRNFGKYEGPRAQRLNKRKSKQVMHDKRKNVLL